MTSAAARSERSALRYVARRPGCSSADLGGELGRSAASARLLASHLRDKRLIDTREGRGHRLEYFPTRRGVVALARFA